MAESDQPAGVAVDRGVRPQRSRSANKQTVLGLNDVDKQTDLISRLRQRGLAMRSHPVANGTIDCTEEAGELLIEAAASLEQVHAFLNAAAGEGLVLDGVDAADLYLALFPERYAATIASIGA